MKKWILGLLAINLIACNSDGTGNSRNSRSIDESYWLGDLKLKNTTLLSRYGLCGNTRARIEQDVVGYGILSLLSGQFDVRNIAGIAWHRGIIQNCRLIKKIEVAMYSDQPYLPEGWSTLYLEPLKITNWNLSYRGNRAYSYQKLNEYIKLETDFRPTEQPNTTEGRGSAFLWYQEAGSEEYGEKLPSNARLTVNTWRTRTDNRNKDIEIEISLGSNIVGTSTLTYIRSDQNYYQSDSGKLSNKSRKIASFTSSLKNHSLLLGLITTLILLIVATLLLIPKNKKV